MLSHGGLAEELIAAAARINGEASHLSALCLDWEDSNEASERRLRETLERLDDDGGGVLILTDMYGGTPFNLAVKFRRANHVEVVTGVNLPMVLRLVCAPVEGLDLNGFAEWIQKKGRSSICRPEGGTCASDLG